MGGLRATYCSSKCDKKLFLIHTNVLVFIHNYIITDVFIQLFLLITSLRKIHTHPTGTLSKGGQFLYHLTFFSNHFWALGLRCGHPGQQQGVLCPVCISSSILRI
jgi:hypothetical protein